VQADTQGGDLNVGGDVVGHDKIESAGGHIIHAAAGATVIIGASPETAHIPRPVKPARLFISYKRNSDPDQLLANALYEILTRNGHQVFMDTTMRTGEAWLEEIDRQLKASDFLIVLLSRQSADSEMVGAEVRRAYKYRKLQGRPQTLPVRVAYEGLLPYPIDAFLNPLQYVVWQSDADTARCAGDSAVPLQASPIKRPFEYTWGRSIDGVDDGRFIATRQPATTAAGIRSALQNSWKCQRSRELRDKFCVSASRWPPERSTHQMGHDHDHSRAAPDRQDLTADAGHTARAIAESNRRVLRRAEQRARAAGFNRDVPARHG
jgi:hypothetical protein